jgi:hypothetical protein
LHVIHDKRHHDPLWDQDDFKSIWLPRELPICQLKGRVLSFTNQNWLIVAPIPKSPGEKIPSGKK